MTLPGPFPGGEFEPMAIPLSALLLGTTDLGNGTLDVPIEFTPKPQFLDAAKTYFAGGFERLDMPPKSRPPQPASPSH